MLRGLLPALKLHQERNLLKLLFGEDTQSHDFLFLPRDAEGTNPLLSREALEEVAAFRSTLYNDIVGITENAVGGNY